MTSAHSSEKRRKGWAFWTIVALAMPVLYVLSSGPMIWLENRGFFPRTEYNEYVYAPLAWPLEHSQTYASWMEWWISLWL